MFFNGFFNFINFIGQEKIGPTLTNIFNAKQVFFNVFIISLYNHYPISFRQYRQKYVHKCMRANMYVHTRTCAYTGACVHTHMHIGACTHARTQTHSPQPQPQPQPQPPPPPPPLPINGNQETRFKETKHERMVLSFVFKFIISWSCS